jgi:hypothetical protein
LNHASLWGKRGSPWLPIPRDKLTPPSPHPQRAMASTIAVSNETKSSSVRTTKDGRQIRYNLQVIQQPERARACGSGAKSSADRRPVDPPPIVELRVFENDQEITFAYNANFFLHASLENARTIAPGRAPSTAPSFPVLTGTPVAGMAYLDRPTPAGYFIFPDLSVRHEGKYRLSFALFENLSEVKDLDPEDPDVIFDGNHFVTHRSEVKSAPFTVFSAKKFPGLSESTALSRMVAEQGCRVRIRRDVRMRRRENKGSKDWDGYDEDEGYDGTRRTATRIVLALSRTPAVTHWFPLAAPAWMTCLSLTSPPIITSRWLRPRTVDTRKCLRMDLINTSIRTSTLLRRLPV